MLEMIIPNRISSEGKRGIFIAAVIRVNEGQMPIIGPTRVTSTLEDGGTCLIVGLDIVLGEGDSEISITKWGNANQGPGE